VELVLKHGHGKKLNTIIITMIIMIITMIIMIITMIIMITLITMVIKNAQLMGGKKPITHLLEKSVLESPPKLKYAT
jgi:uncharacterized membrane protein